MSRITSNIPRRRRSARANVQKKDFVIKCGEKPLSSINWEPYSKLVNPDAYQTVDDVCYRRVSSAGCECGAGEGQVTCPSPDSSEPRATAVVRTMWATYHLACQSQCQCIGSTTKQRTVPSRKRIKTSSLKKGDQSGRPIITSGIPRERKIVSQGLAMSASDTPTLPGNIVRSGSTGSDISADSTVIASPELLTTNPEKGVSGQLPSDSSYAATARDPQAIPSVPKASAAPVPQVSKKPATRQPARLPPWLTRSGYKPKLQSIPEGEPWPAESIIGPAALDPRPAKKPRVEQPAAATSQLAQTHAQVSAITDESSLDMKSAVGASSTDPSSSKTKVTYMDWTPSYEPQVWCSLAANVDAPSATSPASLSCPAPQRMEIPEPNSSAGEQSVSEVASWLCRLMSNWNQAQSADRLKGNKVPQQPAWSCDPQYLDVIPPPLQGGSEVVQALADWCKAQPAQIELINDFVREYYICAQAAAVGTKRQRVGDSGGRNRPAR